MPSKNNYSTALGTFATAADALAAGPEDVRSTLITACLAICTLHGNELAQELRYQFPLIINSLTKREPRYKVEGRSQATVYQMQNRTETKIARKVVTDDERLQDNDDGD